MTNLMTKSSLYDMLSMIIPGFFTIFSFAKIFGSEYILHNVFGKGDHAIANYICIFAISYLVGIIIHRFSQFLFDDCLRNCPCDIKDVATKFEKDRAKREGTHVAIVSGNIVDEYYRKYYKVIKDATSVPIMEAQVSFIRSMVIVIFVACIFALLMNGNTGNTTPPYCCCVISMLIILVGISLLVMYSIQLRIYYRIFEDYYYLYGKEQCSRTTKTTNTSYTSVTPEKSIATTTTITTFDEHNRLDGAKVKNPVPSDYVRNDFCESMKRCKLKVKLFCKNNYKRLRKPCPTIKLSKQEEKKEEEKVETQNTQNK